MQLVWKSQVVNAVLVIALTKALKTQCQNSFFECSKIERLVELLKLARADKLGVNWDVEAQDSFVTEDTIEAVFLAFGEKLGSNDPIELRAVFESKAKMFLPFLLEVKRANVTYFILDSRHLTKEERDELEAHYEIVRK